MRQVKVTTTRPYKDSQKGDVIVCKGKLKLIPQWESKGAYFSIIPFGFCKPIIISETEKIEVGDRVWDGQYFTTKTSSSPTMPFEKKVLALPENFSPKQLDAIAEDRLKDGDEVFVECEKYINTESVDTFDKKELLNAVLDSNKYPVFHIRMNKGNHITLFRKQNFINSLEPSVMPTPRRDGSAIVNDKSEESWDAILSKYESSEEDRTAPLINYLRRNYNPPTPKTK